MSQRLCVLVQVHSDAVHKIVVNEDGIHSLIIHATYPQDAGQYTCIARNKGGEDRFTVHLNVLREYSATPHCSTTQTGHLVAVLLRPITCLVHCLVGH
jgi:hypothetical protein